MKMRVDKKADALYLRLDESAIVGPKRFRREWRWITTKQTKWWAWRCSVSSNALPF